MAIGSLHGPKAHHPRARYKAPEARGPIWDGGMTGGLLSGPSARTTMLLLLLLKLKLLLLSRLETLTSGMRHPSSPLKPLQLLLLITPLASHHTFTLLTPPLPFRHGRAAPGELQLEALQTWGYNSLLNHCTGTVQSF
ncbi:hypothetical protein EJ06DRAFT_140045 [Trichodelitschia bisporula]|uniref:Uncharacterized protein n=1 Tax=Trichodelitschia bisporula TaxID=703511 RepID=A0A6G1HPA5_9PEZI|nr:hypothetical protein EJ06DRAFT_140045 [Trichodelitschia bisporula]